jgi:hypothetical protein
MSNILETPSAKLNWILSTIPLLRKSGMLEIKIIMLMKNNIKIRLSQAVVPVAKEILNWYFSK